MGGGCPGARHVCLVPGLPLRKHPPLGLGPKLFFGADSVKVRTWLLLGLVEGKDFFVLFLFFYCRYEGEISQRHL